MNARITLIKMAEIIIMYTTFGVGEAFKWRNTNKRQKKQNKKAHNEGIKQKKVPIKTEKTTKMPKGINLVFILGNLQQSNVAKSPLSKCNFQVDPIGWTESTAF